MYTKQYTKKRGLTKSQPPSLRKRNSMKNLLLTTVAVFSLASAAMAADVSGKVSVDVAENAAGNWGATTSFDLGVSASDIANASIDLVATPGSDISIDGWSLGTTIGTVALSFGDQGGVFVEGYNGATLADPAIGDSLQLSMGGASVALGFADITADLTDVEKLQAAYALSVAGADVVAAVDYNLDSSDYVIGATASYAVNDALALGGAVTYGDLFAYEATVSTMGITAYLNGDENTMAQNVGAGYEAVYGGLTLGADVNYNLDSSDFTPGVSVSFAF